MLQRNAYLAIAPSIPTAFDVKASGSSVLASNAVVADVTWPKKTNFAPEQLEKMYWTKLSWNNREKTINALDQPKGKKGRSRAAEGINVNMLYIVDMEGNPVDGHHAAEIRKVARGIWSHLLSCSLAPKHWSSASMHAGAHLLPSLD